MTTDRREPDEDVPRSADAERAIDLFARLLESGDDPCRPPDRARFDELVRRHPELRDELLRIWDGMEKVESVRDREPRLQVVKGGVRWRWVGGGIAAAAAAIFAILLLTQNRAPRDLAPTPSNAAPSVEPGIESVRERLLDAGLGYLDQSIGDLTIHPPTAAASGGIAGASDPVDSVVEARLERRVDEIAKVIAAVRSIQDLPDAAANHASERQRGAVRDIVANAPKRWRDRFSAALSNPGGSISEATPLLLAITRDPALQARLLVNQGPGELRATFAELVEAANAPALLRLKAIDLDHGSEEIVGASVFAQSVDPVTGTFGQPEPLGETPLDQDVELSAGDWRITVVEPESSGTRHSELRLMALPGQSLGTRVAFFRTIPDLSKHMVLMPAAPFHFGAPPHAEYTGELDLPLATETSAEFWIDRFEVTCQEYSDFYLEARSHPEWFGAPFPIHCPRILARDGTCPPRLARHAIVDVTWEEAVLYANWAGKRLPTEREWERSARGPLDRECIYPWGDTFPPDGLGCVNLQGSISPLAHSSQAAPAPATSRSPKPAHLLFAELAGCDVDDPAFADGATPGAPGARVERMADNAAELCEDLFVAMRDSVPGLQQSTSVARVCKGASFLMIDEFSCRVWSRGSSFPDTSIATNGFRCVKTTSPGFPPK